MEGLLVSRFARASRCLSWPQGEICHVSAGPGGQIPSPASQIPMLTEEYGFKQQCLLQSFLLGTSIFLAFKYVSMAGCVGCREFSCSPGGGWRESMVSDVIAQRQPGTTSSCKVTKEMTVELPSQWLHFSSVLPNSSWVSQVLHLRIDHPERQQLSRVSPSSCLRSF